MTHKVGDVVRLRSGGPLMTVERVQLADLVSSVGCVHCVWFCEAAPWRRDFPPETLIRQEPPI